LGAEKFAGRYETYDIFEYDRTAKPTLELVLLRVHADDKNFVQQTIAHASEEKANLDFDCRLMMPRGLVKHLHVLARALETSSGNLEYVGAVTDVTAAEQAEEKIRQSEMELRQIMDLGPQQVAVLGPDRSRLYVNQSALDYHGLTLEEWRSCPIDRLAHPEDLERLEDERIWIMAWRKC
jgi:PAS domain-containing protein